MFPPFQACPVTTAEPDTGFAADLRLLPPPQSLADDDSLALDSLLVSAERFITLFHNENRAGPPRPAAPAGPTRDRDGGHLLAHPG